MEAPAAVAAPAAAAPAAAAPAAAAVVVPTEIKSNGAINFVTGLLIVGTLISSILAAYWVRKAYYKDSAAAASFAAIFAIGAFIAFIALIINEGSRFKRVKEALSAAKVAYYK